MYFQVAQKNTSQECLNAIIYFLTKLPKNRLQDTLNISTRNLNSSERVNKILPLNVTSSINIRADVVSLVILSVDALHYHILPYLESHKMHIE